MNKLLLQLCFFTLMFPVFCQARTTEDFTLRAKIIDVGWSTQTNRSQGTMYLFVEFSVTNTSQTKQSFWMMKCSWQESFRTDNEDITFCARECVANYPIQINLNPNDSIIFTSILEAPESAFKNPVFKIGLFMIDEEHLKSLFDYRHNEKYVKSLKTYWSNSLSLNEHLIGYKRNKE
jgi:hypothetical protein